jgi:N-acetylglucosamine-6-phosphate deacetylase
MTTSKNANLILAGEVRRMSVSFSDTIIQIGDCLDENGSFIDGEGLYLAPGFIDIHTHGCAGADIMTGGHAVRAAAAHMPAGGVTAFLPTTVTAPMPDIRRCLEGIWQSRSIGGGAKILGAHLEGPFLAAGYRGAHREELFAKPDIGLAEEFSDILRIVTIAPELPGAEEFIRGCRKLGIQISLGHTGATYAGCAEAVRWGARSFTHIFNAMSPLHHREPGAAGAAMTLENTFCELIADNHHVSIPAQKILFRAAGPDKLILVSDSLPLAQLGGDTDFVWNGQKVRADGGAAKLERRAQINGDNFVELLVGHAH